MFDPLRLLALHDLLGGRHHVREVIRRLADGRYQLRTDAGLRCQISRRPAFWQIDQVLTGGRSAP